jgi:hypothetical protein
VCVGHFALRYKNNLLQHQQRAVHEAQIQTTTYHFEATTKETRWKHEQRRASRNLYDDDSKGLEHRPSKIAVICSPSQSLRAWASPVGRLSAGENFHGVKETRTKTQKKGR